MKKFNAFVLMMALTTTVYAQDIYCPLQIQCKGRTCSPLPKTFFLSTDFYPHVPKHPFEPIPGVYQFQSAHANGLCMYQLGNFPVHDAHVIIQSPVLVADTSAPAWQGNCISANPQDCPFKFPTPNN